MPTRNFILFLAFVVTLLATASVFAVTPPCANGASNPPTCTFSEPPAPPAVVPSSSTSTSGAAAGAAAGAVSGSVSAAQGGNAAATGGNSTAAGGAGGAGGQGGNSTSAAQGGRGGNAAGGAGGSAQQGQQQGQQMGQGQEANSGASITDNSTGGSFKSSMWVLPAPVFTPPLPAIPCPSANTEQMAVAIGFNFISFAKASTNSDNCTAISVYNSYVATCKYASAQQVLNLLSAKVLPGFKASGLVLVDLEAPKCSALLAPVTNVTHNRYETIYQPPAAAPIALPPAVVVVPKKYKKAVVPVSPCPAHTKPALVCKQKVMS
jgi:hypothetical protein